MKSGRASRLHGVPEEVVSGFQGQRTFTAWIATIYAFVLLMLGSVSLAVTIFGRPGGLDVVDALIPVMFVMVTMIPNVYLSSLIWHRVYNGD